MGNIMVTKMSQWRTIKNKICCWFWQEYSPLISSLADMCWMSVLIDTYMDTYLLRVIISSRAKTWLHQEMSLTFLLCHLKILHCHTQMSANIIFMDCNTKSL